MRRENSDIRLLRTKCKYHTAGDGKVITNNTVVAFSCTWDSPLPFCHTWQFKSHYVVSGSQTRDACTRYSICRLSNTVHTAVWTFITRSVSRTRHLEGLTTIRISWTLLLPKFALIPSSAVVLFSYSPELWYKRFALTRVMFVGVNTTCLVRRLPIDYLTTTI